jgi:hypothetical protein
MYIPVSLTSNWNKGKKTVEIKALVDCGAGDAFINKEFVHCHQLPSLPLEKPMGVFNVDGTPNKEGKITHFTRLKTWINRRIKRTAFLIVGLGKEDVILRFPWLRRESPVIDWEQGTLRWEKESPESKEEAEEKEKKEIAEEMKKESKPGWIRAKPPPRNRLLKRKKKKKQFL